MAANITDGLDLRAVSRSDDRAGIDCRLRNRMHLECRDEQKLQSLAAKVLCQQCAEPCEVGLSDECRDICFGKLRTACRKLKGVSE